MRYLFFFLTACSMLSTGCLWEQQKASAPDISRDTLHYSYATFKRRAKDCGDKPDSNCTVIKIKYPVFQGQPALNDTVRHHAAMLFSVYNKPDTNFSIYADNFMKAYEQDMVNRNVKMKYELETNLLVTRQDSSLLTMTLSGYSFLGGAHGSSLTFFMNWNTDAKQHIKLSDILIESYKAGLDTIAEKIFRKQEKLAPTTSLKDNYFFANDSFALPDNFIITPIGLRFLYNEYEIKPYAAGQTELFIPYDQIRPLLRPNTVISQYLH